MAEPLGSCVCERASSRNKLNARRAMNTIFSLQQIIKSSRPTRHIHIVEKLKATNNNEKVEYQNCVHFVCSLFAVAAIEATAAAAAI